MLILIMIMIIVPDLDALLRRGDEVVGELQAVAVLPCDIYLNNNKKNNKYVYIYIYIPCTTIQHTLIILQYHMYYNSMYYNPPIRHVQSTTISYTLKCVNSVIC